MSDVTLTLDGFVFRDFEIPDALPFGGAQALSMKRLIGGARISDAMGAAVLAVPDFAQATQAVIATVLTPIAAVRVRVADLLAGADLITGAAPALDTALPSYGAPGLADSLLGQVLAMGQSADLQEL